MGLPRKKDFILFFAGLLSGVVIIAIAGFIFLLKLSPSDDNFIGNTVNLNKLIRSTTPTPTTTSVPNTTISPTISPTPTTGGAIIGSAVQNNFYEPGTGQLINPRAVNYVRIGNVLDPFTGSTTRYHATFDPGFYNATNVNTALAKMRTDGYNMVRVFISDNGVGDSSGNGLNAAYMNNVTDFLTKANANQIYVIFSLLFLPKAGGSYYRSSTTDSTAAEDVNWIYLTRSGLNGKKRYVTDFVNYLKSKSAPTNRIFSIELDNELHYVDNKKPLSQTSGTFVGINGVSYNLSSQANKNQLMDASLATWLNEMTDTVKGLLPSTLVSCGFLSPYSVAGTDPRTIRTYWAMVPFNEGGSKLDFVDLHLYPQPDFNKTLQELASFEIPAARKKLIMFGEMGIFTGQFSNISTGAQALKNLMRHLCTNSLADGYAAWAWDTTATELPETFSLLQNSEAINNVIKPRNLSNPCN